MLKDILKLRGDRIILFLFVLTGVISPGFGWLLTFEHASFVALDAIRLLVLGTGIALPTFLINFGLVRAIQVLTRTELSFETISRAIPDDVKGRGKALRMHRRRIARQWEREVRNCMLWASLLNVLPLYLPLLAHVYFASSAHAAILLLVASEIIVGLGICIIGYRIVTAPGASSDDQLDPFANSLPATT